MSNQPNEKYADSDTLDALNALGNVEEKLDKTLFEEFGVGEWGAGVRGRCGNRITLVNALMWANGYEKRINEKGELLTTLRKGTCNLKLSVQTIAKRVAAADWGV